jgi:hypothetical protein
MRNCALSKDYFQSQVKHRNSGDQEILSKLSDFSFPPKKERTWVEKREHDLSLTDLSIHQSSAHNCNATQHDQTPISDESVTRELMRRNLSI